MFPLRELLNNALATLLGPRRALQAAALDAWPSVVGEPRARHARVAGIRGNALIVVTDLPALSYELGLRRADLVDALNRRVGGHAIDEIHIIMRSLDSPEDTASGG